MARPCASHPPADECFPERAGHNSPSSANRQAHWRPKPTAMRYRRREPGYPGPPAQIRTCSFPAYGSYLGCMTAKRSRGHGWRILGLGSQSAASFSILCHVVRSRSLRRWSVRQPKAANMVVEDREGATIGRHRVVIKVAADDRSQPFPLDGDWPDVVAVAVPPGFPGASPACGRARDFL